MSKLKMDLKSNDEYDTPSEHAHCPDRLEFDQLKRKIASLRKEVEYLRLLVGFKSESSNEYKKQFKAPPEIKLPIFHDEINDNPLEFMRDFDQYCSIKQIPDQYVPIIIESALQGRARLWYKAAKHNIHDIGDFKHAFADEFFSIEIQTRAKNNWRNREYDSRNDGSTLAFYYHQTYQATTVEPLLSDYEKNYLIVGQFPREVQMALVGIDLEDSRKLAYALSRIDDANKQSFRNCTNWSSNHNSSDNKSKYPNSYSGGFASHESAYGNWRQNNNTLWLNNFDGKRDSWLNQPSSQDRFEVPRRFARERNLEQNNERRFESPLIDQSKIWREKQPIMSVNRGGHRTANAMSRIQSSGAEGILNSRKDVVKPDHREALQATDYDRETDTESLIDERSQVVVGRAQIHHSKG